MDSLEYTGTQVSYTVMNNVCTLKLRNPCDMSNLATLKLFKKGDDPRRNTIGANKGSRQLTTLLREALEVIGKGSKGQYAVLCEKSDEDGHRRVELTS